MPTTPRRRPTSEDEAANERRGGRRRARGRGRGRRARGRRGRRRRRRARGTTTTRTTTTRTATPPATEEPRSRPTADEDAGEEAEAEPPPSPRSTIRAPCAATASSTRRPRARPSPRPGFVEACRTVGVLILTHRRLLVDQFMRDLKEQGYGPRLIGAIEKGKRLPRQPAVTVETYAWFIKHAADINPDAYGVVICDEAHTALGERTAETIRRFSRPTYIGMTATDQLLQKHVGDVFPAEVADFPLADAVRRGVVAPLRALRVKPGASLRNVPVVGGDYDQRALAEALDHEALNMAAAMLYRDRFDHRAGIVYAAGVDHAERVAAAMRATGLRARSVSGRTPPRALAATLAAYERGDINVLVNAQLLAEGWNAPRATICMHLAPTASRRVYQQRIGRVMRLHRRKEAGVVVDFVDPAAPHSDRTVTLHSLLDVDLYKPGSLVTPKPPRRRQRWRRQARPVLRDAEWLIPVTDDPARRRAVIAEHWKTGQRRPPAARRAGVLGRDRRPSRRARRPAAPRRDAREGRRGDAHPLLRDLRGGVQAPLAAAHRARRPGRAPPRHQHDRPHGAPDRGRADLGERPRAGRARAALGDRGGHAARLAVAAPDLDLEAGARLARDAVPRGHRREPGDPRPAAHARLLARRGAPRARPPARGLAAAGRAAGRRRRARRRAHARRDRRAHDRAWRAPSSAPTSRSWPPRSPPTCPSRRPSRPRRRAAPRKKRKERPAERRRAAATATATADGKPADAAPAEARRREAPGPTTARARRRRARAQAPPPPPPPQGPGRGGPGDAAGERRPRRRRGREGGRRRATAPEPARAAGRARRRAAKPSPRQARPARPPARRRAVRQRRGAAGEAEAAPAPPQARRHGRGLDRPPAEGRGG